MENIQLNKTSAQFLNSIFDDLKKYNLSFDIKNFSSHSKSFSNAQLINIPSFSLYNKKVIQCITEMDKEIHTYKFKVNKRNIETFIILNKNKQNKKKFVHNVIKKTYSWLSAVDKYSDENCSKNLQIYLFMSPSMKLLPDTSTENLEEKNVNTAFTYTCNRDNMIHIYREEEWFKVLIHETFHNLNMDFSRIDNGYSNKFAKNIFNLNIDFKIYESYCEFWATVINCVFYLTEKDSFKKNDFNKNINECLNRELEHSLFQCAKILNHFEMSYTDLYNKTEEANFARLYKYKEDTPVISYYFFKTILLFNCNEFIEWCLQNNEPTLNFSQNTKDIYKKIEIFTSFINEQSKNKDFVNQIQDIQKKFQKNKKKLRSNDIIIYTSLKMTYHNTE